MNFQESELYLLSLGNEVSAMKLGLDNIRTLLAELGDPQNKYLKVQVAGTNGKGSVCAFLDAICRSADVNVGVFTSPHLVSITDRIRINGQDISEGQFAKYAAQVRDTAEKLLEHSRLRYRPTFFEQVTAIALLAFADANVDLAILETGLGGRLDATTAAHAEIAAITPIGLDHQEYLGETLTEIAAEKAAIIHAGSRVVVAAQEPEADAAIQKRLADLGIAELRTRDIYVTGATGLLSFSTPKGEYRTSQIGMKGEHQIENAKVAILLAEILQDTFPITPADIAAGLEKARHPGRLEGAGRYLFDGAHNEAGAAALAAFLDEFVHVPVTMIFAAMKGKDIAKIAQLLFPRAHKLILTQPTNSRALTADELRTFADKHVATSSIFTTGSVTDALEIAEELTDEKGIILVTGSLYLVGEAKQKLMQRSEI